MKKTFSFKNVFTTQNMVVMAMMIACKVVLSYVGTIRITPDFKLFNLAYLPSVAVGALYGPWAGLAFGAISDVTTFFFNPVGPFIIGYTFSEMVSCFIYGAFLYNQRPIRWWNVVLARLVVMVTVIFGLNFIWDSLVFGKVAGEFFTSFRLLNNLWQFPLHVILILTVSRLAVRTEKQFNKNNKHG